MRWKITSWLWLWFTDHLNNGIIFHVLLRVYSDEVRKRDKTHLDIDLADVLNDYGKRWEADIS